MLTCNGKEVEFGEDTIVGYTGDGNPIFAVQLSRWVYEALAKVGKDEPQEVTNHD